MPRMVSWMVLLTFDMARCAPVEVYRAILRNASATSMITGAIAQRDQSKLPVAIEEKRGNEDDQQHLAGQTQRERDDVGELFGIAGDARDDASRLLLIEKRHVAPHDRFERVEPQAEDDIAHDPRRARLPDVVEEPGESAGDQDGNEKPPDPRTQELVTSHRSG